MFIPVWIWAHNPDVFLWSKAGVCSHIAEDWRWSQLTALMDSTVNALMSWSGLHRTDPNTTKFTWGFQNRLQEMKSCSFSDISLLFSALELTQFDSVFNFFCFHNEMWLFWPSMHMKSSSSALKLSETCWQAWTMLHWRLPGKLKSWQADLKSIRVDSTVHSHMIW